MTKLRRKAKAFIREQQRIIEKDPPWIRDLFVRGAFKPSVIMTDSNETVTETLKRIPAGRVTKSQIKAALNKKKPK